MTCPECSSQNTHPVGLGHMCENCRAVWLSRSDPHPAHIRTRRPAQEEEQNR